LLLNHVLEIFIVFEVISSLIVGVPVLSHGVTVLDSSVAGLIEVVPAQLHHGRVAHEFVQAIQRKAV